MNCLQQPPHTHWLSVSWWLGYLSVGAICTAIAIFSFFVNGPDLFAGRMGVLDYAGMLFALLVMLPFGVGLLALPFGTKVAVGPFGLEYHTLGFIMYCDWRDLVTVGPFDDQHVGKTLVLVPRSGNIYIKKWMRPIRKALKINSQAPTILLAQFGPSHGHSLVDDVIVNVSSIANVADM